MRIVEDYVLEENGQISPLWDYPPLHSPAMKETCDLFREELSHYEFHSLRYPVISNSKALPYDRDLPIADTLIEQLTKPVQWNGIMQYFKKFGISSVIEMGPKIMLSNFVEEMNGNMKGFCYGQKQIRETLPEMLWKGNNQSEVMPTLVTKCLAVSASTPNNNLDEQEYEKGVIEANSVIKQIYEQNRKDGQSPSLEQSQKAILYLKKILETKKVSLNEQNEWMKQILDETGMLYELKSFVTENNILG
jgi:[acyl-carrier-protein] S-malonyltransferase